MKLLTSLSIVALVVSASNSRHYAGKPQAHNDPEALLGDEAPIGSSPYYPMRFILPVGEEYEYTLLEIWNSVKGRYLEDQEWTLHGRMIAEYVKKPGVTYKAGICIPIQPPHADHMDCFQVQAGWTRADDLVIETGEKDAGSGLWNNTYTFPLDDISQSWGTDPVGFINGEWVTDQLAVETCDEVTNKCTLTFAFNRDFETDAEERENTRAKVEDYLITYNEYTHHDIFAFVDRQQEGGEHDRLVSDAVSVWLRASTVEEAVEAPEAMAEWSVFASLFGCIVLFWLVQKYRNYMYKLAIQDLKKQQSEMQEMRDRQDREDEESAQYRRDAFEADQIKLIDKK